MAINNKFWNGLWVLIAMLVFPLVATHAVTGPAVISGVHVDQVTTSSVHVAWTTSNPSTSVALIARDSLCEAERWAPDPVDSTLTTNHRVLVDHLIPQTTYYYYVASKSAAGVLSTAPGPGSCLKFTTATPSAGGAPSYTFQIYGPKNVFAGSDLWVAVQSMLLGGPNAHLYDHGATVTGLTPATVNSYASISTHFACLQYDPNGDGARDGYFDTKRQLHYCWMGNNDSANQVLRLRTAPYTTPGPYSVTLSLESNGQVVQQTFNFNVLPAPQGLSRAQGSAYGLNYQAIPGKAKWESAMTTLGEQQCQAREQHNAQGDYLVGFGYEADSWYYDGGRVFLQIGDYTGNHDRWNHCAQLILDPYSGYINAGGSLGGWRIFPFGMAMYYWRTGDANYRNAVNQLATTSAWVNYGGRVDAYYIRETAYVVDTWVAAEQLGRPRDRLLLRAVDKLIGHLDQMEYSNVEVHPFMVGLALEALINYYEMTAVEGRPDYRIPAVIKTSLDYMWTNWPVDKAKYGFIYNRYTLPTTTYTQLNNLVLPAYAWYWNKTADSTYLSRGDLLFSHSLDAMPWGGKEFSQNYKWSFDYVRWRSGTSASTVARSSNPQSGVIADTAPPLATNIAVVSTSASSVQITWRTYEKADSQVVYGLTGTYGVSSPVQNQGGGMTTSHTVNLTGLQNGATYHYRVRSRDAAGNLAAMGDQTFVAGK